MWTPSSQLHDAHRTACLRHDEQGQAVLLNLLTRNYLHFNMHDQANKLISKANFPEGVSNNQFVRHLFFKGMVLPATTHCSCPLSVSVSVTQSLSPNLLSLYSNSPA